MNRFVIVNTENTADNGLFWSNADGWTDGDDFDVFTLEESETLSLPIGGEWARLQTI
jgi:hypothetical protein